MDVIDFSDPTTPVLRDPVSIPGTLLGIGVAGEIVYTQNSATGSQTVDALAYDGVAAYLVASLPPGTNSFNPAVVVGGTVVTATGGSAPALKAWQLGRNKQFQQLGSAPLAQEAYALRGFDNLVVAENGWGLQLLNLGNPANPVVGGGVSSMCL